MKRFISFGLLILGVSIVNAAVINNEQQIVSESVIFVKPKKKFNFNLFQFVFKLGNVGPSDIGKIGRKAENL